MYSLVPVSLTSPGVAMQLSGKCYGEDNGGRGLMAIFLSKRQSSLFSRVLWVRKSSLPLALPVMCNGERKEG